MKRIGILGSTGSVGSQALEIIKENFDKFEVVFLSANSNIEKLHEQYKIFSPKYICLSDQKRYKEAKQIFKESHVLSEFQGMIDLCRLEDVDIILNSISGYKGVFLSLETLKFKTDLALSNKESIVQAGHLLMPLALKNNTNIFPVDSEHSALWQCLVGEKKENIKKIILTASGGPFRTLGIEEFKQITKEQALNHPNWEMGKKITIDSATMMNKGFEVIEAFWLFSVSYENIDIVVHPQSIIHSLVEFVDGSVKAQLSDPTMKIPIQYAFTYPNRIKMKEMNFNFVKNNHLTFEEVDLKKFKCIKLAYEAGKNGGSYPTVLNVSNDIAVDLFLKDVIDFNSIPKIVDSCMQKHQNISKPSIEEIEYVMESTEKFIYNQLVKVK